MMRSVSDLKYGFGILIIQKRYGVELRHLRYFVSVAELGSFTRAAQALAVAQPALSNQIRDLETEIGAVLLVRHRRGISLTPAGEIVLKEAREILAHAARLKRASAQAAGATGGSLTVGFIASASHFLLPQVLRALRERHPDILVEARELLSAEQVAALQNGTLDAAICRPPIRAKTLAVVAKLNDPFCLAMRSDHPLARVREVELQAAAETDFVSFKRDQARAFFDQTLNFCTAAGFSPTIRYEAGTIFGVLHLVAAGVGVAIVPASCGPAAGPEVALRRLVRPTRPGALVLVCRKVDRSPTTGALISSAREAFAQLDILVSAKIDGE